MKLLFFIGSLAGGGAERVMVILCNELVERGYKVYIATNTKIPFAYKLDERIEVINLFERYKFESGKILRNIRLVKNIRSIVKDIKPNVMIPFMFGLSSHVILSTLDMKIPIISSEHNTFDKSQSKSIHFKRFYINSFARYTTILTEYDREFLGEKLKNKVVLPNPLAFKIEKDIGIKENVVFAAGSIDRWKHKGFDNLIKIWGGVSPKFPEWKLQIAGSGSEENFLFLRSIAKEMKVEHSIEFLGFQKNLNELLQQKAIFVLSSRWEGFGMVLLEAISQGCAAVSYDLIAGPNEIITHNKSGLLVENQNMKEMENALIRLMSDKQLRTKLAEGGLKEAERFTADKIVDKWEGLFRSVKEYN